MSRILESGVPYMGQWSQAGAHHPEPPYRLDGLLSQGMKAGLQLTGPYVVQINRNRAKTQINDKAYDIEGW